MRALLLALAVLLAAAFALLAGEVHLGWSGLWQGLAGADTPAGLTLRILRAPRVAVALGAGAAFGLAGAVFQLLLRNPLASPDLMGFAQGAGLAVLACIALRLPVPPPVAASLGGLAAAALIGLLAHRRGEPAAPLRLVLVGLGFGFTCAAVASFLMLRLPGPEAAEAQRWLTGSLAARGWGHVAQVWGLGLPLALLLALQLRRLALLELGDDLATGLGLNAGPARLALAATAVGLMAVAVSVAGPVAFVALMAGPLGAAVTGARAPAPRLLAAALAGALMTVLADLAARAALPGLQLPLGVMTGLLGAPYLLWQLAREGKRDAL